MKEKNIFPKIKGKLLVSEPLSRHTTFRIGGACKVWAEPSDETDLKKILKFANSKNVNIFTIGMGSNILFRENSFNGIMIHLGGEGFKKVKFTGQKVRSGAGTKLGRLINLTCNEGLRGIEGLVGIPGTLGGAIFMNAGYRGSVSDTLSEVKLMDRVTGAIERVKREDINFGYRRSGKLRDYIILEATLSLEKGNKAELLKQKKKLLDEKRDKQPLHDLSAGCIFKNPDGKVSAARYIEMSRLKGKRIGGAKVSDKHANFIVNMKDAKESDVLRLIDFVKKRVKLQFGVDLDTEIIIV